MEIYLGIEKASDDLFKIGRSMFVESDFSLPAHTIFLVEPDLKMASCIVDASPFDEIEPRFLTEFIGSVMAKATREMRAKAIIDALEQTAEKDTMKALASELADYDLDNLSEHLRALADAIDAA
jgi:hypothetical protein